MIVVDRPVRTIPLAQRILDAVRQHRGRWSQDDLTGAVANTLDVTDRIAVVEAFHELEKQGLATVSGNESITLSAKGRKRDVQQRPERKVKTHERRPGQTTSDRVLEWLDEQGGAIEDPNGRCITTIERALGIRNGASAVAMLVRRGLVTKDAKPRTGTTRVALTTSNGHPAVDTLSERARWTVEVMREMVGKLDADERKRVLSCVSGS